MKKSYTARLEKLDKLARVNDQNSPPIFIHWLGHPWTEEEKSKAIRKYPDQPMFWKSLSATVPLEGLRDPIFLQKKDPTTE